jgi:hypothetical protein
MFQKNGFVADGYRRACAAIETRIRTEVAADYAARLSRASLFERLRLHAEMRRAIRRRIHELAPPDALY